jgi:hypothetical protein
VTEQVHGIFRQNCPRASYSTITWIILWSWSTAPSLIKLNNIFNVNGRKEAFVILLTGPNILIYIFIENQQMHQNDHFNVMLNQKLLHVSAYQRHYQGAHMILTIYVYVGVHTFLTIVRLALQRSSGVLALWGQQSWKVHWSRWWDFEHILWTVAIYLDHLHNQ